MKPICINSTDVHLSPAEIVLEELNDLLDDLVLAKIIRARQSEKSIRVSLNEL